MWENTIRSGGGNLLQRQESRLKLTIKRERKWWNGIAAYSLLILQSFIFYFQWSCYIKRSIFSDVKVLGVCCMKTKGIMSWNINRWADKKKTDNYRHRYFRKPDICIIHIYTHTNTHNQSQTHPGVISTLVLSPCLLSYLMYYLPFSFAHFSSFLSMSLIACLCECA